MKVSLGLRIVGMVVTLLGVTLVGPAAEAAPTPNYPTGAIESKYYQQGPWPVTARAAFACCATSGAAFDVWYPSELGKGGVRHPIITWGNGTDAVPRNYARLLAHLASWGFVVIASESKATGTGQDILDAAKYLIGQDGVASSIFFHKLDTAAVGAIGHSQGAAGVLNAMQKSGGAIRTAVPIEVPSQKWCSNAASCADPRRLGSGAVFFVNGSADGLISPSTQLLPWQLEGLQSNKAYYEATPSAVAKAWGTLNGPDHNDVQGQPDCAAANKPCANGVYGYLGYPTAWFMDRLRGDAVAHQAFVTGVGEFFHQKVNWRNQMSNIPR